MNHRLWIASFVLAGSLAGCTATVSTPPPAQPMPPPPQTAQQPPPPPPSQPPVVVAPSKHPAYLRALSDLRAARGYLARPAKSGAVTWDENRAVQQIDNAMGLIQHASIDDGKNLNDHPPIDAALIWGDRLHRALELVETARRDVTEEEDNSFANGLKTRAIQAIDGSARFIKEGIEDAQKHPVAPPPPVAEPAHPAYLHALTDMRAARFLLEKPAKPDVKWDESRAIREIDAAIKEIREASIDDGKDLNDHPPLDSALDHHGRLQRAAELLSGAAADIEKREDNVFAKNLRKHSIERLRNAERYIREAIHDKKQDAKETKEERHEEKMEKQEHKGH